MSESSLSQEDFVDILGGLRQFIRRKVMPLEREIAEGADTRIGPSVAMLYCTEMVGRVADLAVQIHGGAVYIRDYFVEQIYRDDRLLRLYEGTSEIQRLIIGSNLVKQELASN